MPYVPTHDLPIWCGRWVCRSSERNGAASRPLERADIPCVLVYSFWRREWDAMRSLQKSGPARYFGRKLTVPRQQSEQALSMTNEPVINYCSDHGRPTRRTKDEKRESERIASYLQLVSRPRIVGECSCNAFSSQMKARSLSPSAT
jgi:hypothetical protein